MSDKKDPKNYDFEKMRKEQLGETEEPVTEYEELSDVEKDHDDSDMGAQDYICGVPVTVSLGYLNLASSISMPTDRDATEAESLDMLIKAFYLFASGDTQSIFKYKAYNKMNSEKAKDKAVDFLVEFEQKAYDFFASSGVEIYGQDFYTEIDRKISKFVEATQRIPEQKDNSKKNN